MSKLGMTLQELAEAAKARKAVVCDGQPCYGKPKPAAVVFNMPGSVLIRALPQLRIYDKPEATHRD